MVLDAGSAGAATLVIWDGRIRVHPGRTRTPTTRISGDRATIVSIIGGEISGLDAFLDGHIHVEGDVGLSLHLDGLLGTAQGRMVATGVIESAGVRTALVEAGARRAPIAVLLHGLGATSASMLPVLRDLALDHRVIAPDLPGHGASSAPPVRYDAAFFATWLEALLDAKGVDKAVIVGNSLGGRIGLELGLRRPARTSALVLLAPAVAFRRLRQAVPLVRLLRPELAGLPLPTVALPEWAVAGAIRLLFAHPGRLPPGVCRAAAGEWARVYRSRPHRVAFASALKEIYLDDAFGDEGFWRRLPSLLPPALFVWGARDVLVPAAFARHVVAAVPSAHSVVLPDCGHVPQFEQPARTAFLTRAFLADAGPAESAESAGPAGPAGSAGPEGPAGPAGPAEPAKSAAGPILALFGQ